VHARRPLLPLSPLFSCALSLALYLQDAAVLQFLERVFEKRVTLLAASPGLVCGKKFSRISILERFLPASRWRL
jgi:hypothetical protein